MKLDVLSAPFIVRALSLSRNNQLSSAAGRTKQPIMPAGATLPEVVSKARDTISRGRVTRKPSSSTLPSRHGVQEDTPHEQGESSSSRASQVHTISKPPPNTSRASTMSTSQPANGTLTPGAETHWRKAKRQVMAAARFRLRGKRSNDARNAEEGQMYLDTIQNAIDPSLDPGFLARSGPKTAERSGDCLPTTPAPSIPTSKKEHQSLSKFPSPPSPPTVIVPVGQIGSPGAASRKPEHSSRRSAPRSQTYGLFPLVRSKSSDDPELQGRKQRQAALIRQKTSP